MQCFKKEKKIADAFSEKIRQQIIFNYFNGFFNYSKQLFLMEIKMNCRSFVRQISTVLKSVRNL